MTTLSAANLMSRTCCIALPLGLMLMWGCSNAEYRSSSLSGKVTVDDQPLDGGNLLLLTEDGAVSGAVIKSDGTYKLDCNPGTYKIAVAPPDVLVGADGVPLDPTKPASLIAIPKKYQDVGTSELVVEVTDGGNSHDINLVSN